MTLVQEWRVEQGSPPLAPPEPLPCRDEVQVQGSGPAGGLTVNYGQGSQPRAEEGIRIYEVRLNKPISCSDSSWEDGSLRPPSPLPTLISSQHLTRLPHAPTTLSENF